MQLQNEIENPIPKSEMTFRELYNEWLVIYEKEVQNSTYYKTTRAFDKHVLPKFGDTRLSDFTPLMLQDYQNDLADKLKFARKLFGMIRKVFNHAALYGYIQANPALPVTSSKVKRTAEDKKDFYNPDELKEFMKLVEQTGNPKKIALFRLLAFTGIRIGLEVAASKTKASIRLISLDDKTCNILDQLHKTYPKTVRIFESENGGILSPSKPRKWLHTILNHNELEPIRIHGFRHTHASLLFDSGMSLKQVQYRLGHFDLKTTMNVYTHITEFAKDNIGDKFSAYIDF